MQKVIFLDLGKKEYEETWNFQQSLLDEKVRIKRANWQLEREGKTGNLPQEHHLIFVEHPHVYTLGKSGSLENLLLSEKELEEKGAVFFKINRGGDITYHGPGQVVGYPIFDLEYFFKDVHKYVRSLEEVIMRTCADYGVETIREEGFSGVWLSSKGKKPKRKICAVGVHLSRWITMHGFAFNVNTDLNFFKNMIPCGIDDPEKDVTSLSKELGREIDMEEVKKRLRKHFAGIFDFEYK